LRSDTTHVDSVSRTKFAAMNSGVTVTPLVRVLLATLSVFIQTPAACGPNDSTERSSSGSVTR